MAMASLTPPLSSSTSRASVLQHACPFLPRCRNGRVSLAPARLGARASANSGETSANSRSETEEERSFPSWSRSQLLRSASLGASVSLLAALPPLPATWQLQQLGLSPDPALAFKEIEVGSYLPSAGVDNFVVFSAGPKDTPALRAGNVPPYKFFLTPAWTQQRVANILSGNYCQPKCAEPWIEVKFEDPKQGTLQVVASPMVRLTNKLEATIEEIGPPEAIIAALGPFVTGDSYEAEEVVETGVKSVDGQTYYTYTLETPYARSGAHNLAAATAKGSSVLLLVISASDSQWASSEKVLRKLADSFRV